MQNQPRNHHKYAGLHWLMWVPLFFGLVLCIESVSFANESVTIEGSSFIHEKPWDPNGSTQISDENVSKKLSHTSIHFLIDQSASVSSSNTNEEENQTSTLLNSIKKLIQPEDAPSINELYGENCVEKGDIQNGSISCLEQHESGAAQETFIQYQLQGNLYKRQTIMIEYDVDGKQFNKKSVRQKVVLSFSIEGIPSKESEHFDIVKRPKNGAITRELIVVQYHPEESGATKKMTWAKYRQIAETNFAEISHHATLSYDQDGNPTNGRVEKWEDQSISDTLMKWNKLDNQHFRIERTDWKEWENWLLKTVRSAIYP